MGATNLLIFVQNNYLSVKQFSKSCFWVWNDSKHVFHIMFVMIQQDYFQKKHLLYQVSTNGDVALPSLGIHETTVGWPWLGPRSSPWPSLWGDPLTADMFVPCWRRNESNSPNRSYRRWPWSAAQKGTTNQGTLWLDFQRDIYRFTQITV